MLPSRILAVAMAVALVAVACESSDSPTLPTAIDTPAFSAPTPPPDVIEVRIRELVIQADTAATAEERGQGLSDRPSLADDAGMLFFMTEERIPGFHMNDMLFPLDFVWIGIDGTLVDLTENVSHPAAIGGEVLTGISPTTPVMYVLEVNAGVIATWGLQIGDLVAFEPDVLASPADIARSCREPAISTKVAADGNLVANGSFEEGVEPWCSLDSSAWGAPFSVSDAQASDGEQSALLQLRSDDGGEVRVYGVVQEVAPEELPRILSAQYYVDSWRQGTQRQYLQAVVIIWGAENAPPELAGVSNHQIRYILAGVDSQPTFIENARYVMVSEEPPRVGEWVSFERDVRQDFVELWGAAPEGFDRLRVLFEVRWDDRAPDDETSSADVYYDDLYFGSGG